MTAVILVHNVEAHIVHCLKSILELPDSIEPIVNEVVLVNHNSTDDTLVRAEKYITSLDHPPKYKVVDYEGEFEFDKARNLGIKHCTTDVIMMIDSDERLVITHEELFRQFARNVGHGWTVGCLPNKNPTIQYNNQVDFIESEMRRIFPNTENYYYQTPIHEVLQMPDDAIAITVPGAYVAHLGYDLSREEMDAKYDRNMGALVGEADRNITNGVTWYYIGNMMGLRGKFEGQKQAYALALHHGCLGIGIEKYIENKLINIDKIMNEVGG